MGKDNSKKRRGPALPPLASSRTAAKSIPAKAGRVAEDECLIIRFDHVDADGPWCPSKASSPDWLTIFDAIKKFESMHVQEAFKGYPGKDYQSIDGMIKQARDRLQELELDDQDISCLRLGGTERLWGFRRSRYFHVLWWDPHHHIWPSTLRHT